MLHKIITLFCFLTISSSSFAQLVWNPKKTKPAIEQVKTTHEGYRMIFSKERAADSKTEGGCLVKVTAMVADADTLYNVLFTFSKDKPLVIKKGTKGLFKLADDSIVEVTCASDSEDRVGKYMGYHVTLYTAHFTVDLDNELLQEFSKGISKMGFAVNEERLDYPLKKDNISDFILQSFMIVREEARKNAKFEDGF